MADQFPGSLRQAGERLAQQGTIAGTLGQAGLDHSNHAVGRKQSGAPDPLQGWPGEGVQHAHLAVSLPEISLAFEEPRGQRFYGNERIADGANAANPRGSQQGHQNLRKDVGVFMGIEVSHLKTGGLNFSYLRSDFCDQLVAIEASQHGARGEG